VNVNGGFDMEKKKLSLNEIEVKSFTTGPAAKAKGGTGIACNISVVDGCSGPPHFCETDTYIRQLCTWAQVCL
jgi:hypothetical protein